jgi:hypothetical protein
MVLDTDDEYRLLLEIRMMYFITKTFADIVNVRRNIMILVVYFELVFIIFSPFVKFIFIFLPGVVEKSDVFFVRFGKQ